MKKAAVLLAVLFIFTICLSSPSLPGILFEKNGANTFLLPESLEMIEDEAFEATAAKTVVFSDSLGRIGQRAFANSPELKTVTIPESVVYIGDRAFEGVSGLVICGMADSYAARWAQEHDVAFTTAETTPVWIETLIKLLGGGLFVSLPLCICPCISLRRCRRILDAWRSMRPQDRPELYPIDYRFP